MRSKMKTFTLSLSLLTLAACGSSGSAPPEPETPVVPPSAPTTPVVVSDNTPEVFALGRMPNAFPNMMVSSGAVSILDISDERTVSITGGQFAIDDGEFQSDAATINAGQKIRVQVMSSGDALGESMATLSVGDFSTDFVVVTANIANRIEAESTQNTATLALVETSNASGGQAIDVSDPSQSLSFAAMKTGSVMSIKYQSNNNQVLEIDLDGNTRTVSLLNTNGAFQSAEVFMPIALNSSVTLSLQATATNTNMLLLDYVDILDDLNATTAADNMGAGFNLGQMFESDQHAPTLENAKPKIDAYYQAGYRNVRIPVTWTEAIDGSTLVESTETGAINADHPRLAELVKVIEYSLSLEGMYVIVNMHHEAGLKVSDNYPLLEGVWDGISEMFAAHSHRLLFEILNEPHQGPNDEPMAASSVRRMTQLAYAKIRARNPERIIIIGGNQWFGATEMANTWPDLSQVGNGDDEHIMATFHHYAPWEFNGQNNKTFAWDDNTITNEMAIMEQWASTVGKSNAGNDMPIYIGEWGNSWNQYLNTASCNNIKSWYDKFADELANSRPITTPTAVWDDGGWFMVWDHANNDWNNNMYQCMTGTCMAETFERMNDACTDTQ